MIVPVGRLAACLAITTPLAACVAAPAAVDGASPRGWSALGERTYSCARPACPYPGRAGHERIALGPSGDTLFETNDEATRRAFQTAFDSAVERSRLGAGRDYRIEGPITRAMIGAHETLRFAVTGSDAGGAPAEPGHAIVLQKDGRFHMVFAFADTETAARAAALDFVNAITL